MTKKVYEQFLPDINKNLNWEILTENLVTWDGVKEEKI